MDTLNLDKLKVTKSVYFPVDLLSVARTPNSEHLWIGGGDFKLYFLDFSAAKPLPVALEGHTSQVSGVVMAEKVLVSAGWDRKLIWWDVEKRRPIRTVDAHRRWIRQIALSPDRRLVASVSDDMTCKLWDVTSGKMTRELRGHESSLPRYDYPNKLYACAFSPDGKFLAASDELCRVIVWEVSSGKEAARFDAAAFFTADWDRNNHPYGGLRALAFSPDGRSLALGGMKNTDVAIINGHGLVQVYDWKAGKLTHDLKGGQHLQFETLWFPPGSEWLLALVGGTPQKPSLCFFDLKQKRLIKEIANHSTIFGLAVGDKGDTLYTVGRSLAAKWECPA